MNNKLGVFAIIIVSALACQQIPEDMEKPENTSIQNFIPIQQTNLYLDDSLAKELEAMENTPATKAGEFGKYLNEIEVISIERLFPDAGEFEPRTRAAGLHKWYVLQYKSKLPATKAMLDISDIPGVESVETPVAIKPMATTYPFDDPYLYRQWNYFNDGSNGRYAGMDVNVFPVWKNITVGNASVVVAVVDSGVDYRHEDLAANVNLADSRNFCNSDANIEASSHGTHVAGTIAAINNNGTGVCGIAGGDYQKGIAGTTIISCQILTESGSGSGNSAQAIKWAADHGAVIANNSWGYDYEVDGNYNLEQARSDHEFFLQPNEGAYKHSLKDAIDYFNQYAGFNAQGEQTGPMAGGVCFFSAGNDRQPYGVPACYPGVISVGAVGPRYERAYYSNYGDWVDIAAPGGDANYELILSTLPNNSYGSYQGTSMSCPHVSGVAALVVAACGGKGFTRDMLIEKILGGVNPNISLSGMNIGAGLADAYSAIYYGSEEVPDVVNTLKATAKSNTITLEWNVTGTGTIPASGYFIRCGKNSTALDQEFVFPISGYNIGEKVQYEIKNLDFETTYYLQVLGYISPNNLSEPSNMISVTTQINNPPVVTPSEDMSNVVLKATETKSYAFVIIDSDGHDFTIQHIPGSPAELWRSNLDGTYSMQISAQLASAGTYTSHIVVTDKFGASTDFSFSYRINENTPPVISKEISNVVMTSPGESFSLPLSEYFSDPDGDVLTFSATNNSPAALHVTTNNNKLTVTAIKDGIATIMVKASDALEKSAETQFMVAVRTTGKEISCYPNPVIDILYVAGGENEASANIIVYSASGQKVAETSASCSIFKPAQVDLTHCAPGIYSVNVSYNGNTFKQTVVKK